MGIIYPPQSLVMASFTSGLDLVIDLPFWFSSAGNLAGCDCLYLFQAKSFCCLDSFSFSKFTVSEYNYHIVRNVYETLMFRLLDFNDVVAFRLSNKLFFSSTPCLTP